MNDNQSTMTESISTINVDRHNTDHKIIEFMQDLKAAIQSGEFQRYEQQLIDKQQANGTYTNGDSDCQPPMTSLLNVNNLSNQTFNYIINWLKQQNKETNSDLNQVKESGDEQAQTQTESSTEMLRNQMQQTENEKNKLLTKYKELQEENCELRSKVIGLKNLSYSANNSGMMSEAQADSQLLQEKEFEIGRLNRIVEDLVKANDEKDKRIDELTKQVHRFKRIQEIVLKTQNTNFKNKIDLDFDTNSDSNSLPSINGDDIQLNNQLLTTAKQQIKKHQMSQNPSQTQQPSTNTQINSPTIGIPNTPSNPLTLASNINHACSLISSCSLSSSLSSSSTASSASTSSSAPQTANTNTTNLVAPLATISELNNSCSHDISRKSGKSMDHYNTLPSSLNTLNDVAAAIRNNDNTAGNDKYRSANKLGTCRSTSSNNSSNTMVDECINDTMTSEIGAGAVVTTANGGKTSQAGPVSFSQNLDIFKMNKKNKKAANGSLNSLNNDLLKKTNQQVEKNEKYLSTCSVNRTGQHNNIMKKQQSVPPQSCSNKTSPSHNTNSIKSFFGKLIRTSLVNINESGFSTMDKNHKLKAKQQESFDDSANRSLNTSSFKRGGVRATANARLQNHNFSVSNTSLHSSRQPLDCLSAADLDTLTFAKWSSDQVYEWLSKNGFEAYFPMNSDGYVGHKWIKNGLHLLQATAVEYEKELGIKNLLHRKRLGLLLQSLYNSSNFTKLEINYTNYIDGMWVTKWLDDVGLPQYKDVFIESKIDGMMLNNLTNEDLHSMNIQSEMHYLSIKRAVHVLRLKEYDPHCLRRRPSGDELLDKSEVILWTNHRVMEWLRSIDLSEYAPNLRGSGVHGALMVLEGRFNSTVLADILAIPASKTLLRRHLNTLFIDLIGQQMYQHKCEAESQPGYTPLSASTKVKLNKSRVGLFGSHKRAKSQDREFLSAPVLRYGEEFKGYDAYTSSLAAPVNAMIASFREETAAFDRELSMGRKSKKF